MGARMMFERINYNKLNARQKENHNFQKIAAHLADYGFNCLRLTDDWQGADFIACHLNGVTFWKVQLKGRLAIDKKYLGKDIHVGFLHHNSCYVYPHDDFVNEAISRGSLREESSLWTNKGSRSWSKPPKWALKLLEDHRYN